MATEASLVRGWQHTISSRRMSLSTTRRVLCSLSFIRARGVTAPETTPRFSCSISSVQKLRRDTPSLRLTSEVLNFLSARMIMIKKLVSVWSQA